MTCPICYNKHNDLNCFWKCNHEFCRECISNWRTLHGVHANCPICREQNLRGYRNTLRIMNLCLKHTYRFTMYTYRFIIWVCKDLNDFVEENRNADNAMNQSSHTFRDHHLSNEGNAINIYQIRLRHARNVY